MNLYPFQHEGAEWLSQKRYSLLADVPGLGKTAQAIVACDMAGAQKILVICPASVRRNWEKEFTQFSIFDRPFTAMTKTTGKPGAIGVTAVSYELAERGKTHEALLAERWDVLIIDEVHFIKAKTSLPDRAQAVSDRAFAILQRIGGRAKKIFALTGTPWPNGYAAELWPLLRTFGATGLTFAQFVDRYSTGHHNGYGFQITGNKNTAEFKRLLEPVMLRRTHKDVAMQLPELTIASITVEAGPVDTELYFIGKYGGDQELIQRDLTQQRGALEQMFEVVKYAESASSSAAKILEGMGQASSTFHRWTGLAKVDPVIDLVNTELASGLEKIVLFAHHRDVIVCLREGLKKHGAVMYFGGMDDAKKEKHLKKFINDPKCRVFIGNIRAAGTGLDGLQLAAHNALIVEPSWVPDENSQAVMRLHRNGQTKPVLVRFVTLNDSVDERITDVLKRKTRERTKICD